MPGLQKLRIKNLIDVLTDESPLKKAPQDFENLKIYLSLKEYQAIEEGIINLIKDFRKSYTGERQTEIANFLNKSLLIIRNKNIPEKAIFAIATLANLTALFITAALFLTPIIPFIVAASCLALTTGFASNRFFNESKLKPTILNLGQELRALNKEDLTTLLSLDFGS